MIEDDPYYDYASPTTRREIDKMIAEAVAAERERCARLVEGYRGRIGIYAVELAATIRKGEQ